MKKLFRKEAIKHQTCGEVQPEQQKPSYSPQIKWYTEHSYKLKMLNGNKLFNFWPSYTLKNFDKNEQSLVRRATLHN